MSTLRVRPQPVDNLSMEVPDRCPECGSGEIAQIERYSSLHGTIRTVGCRACHWSADPRIGRPPADRSKNVGLRRMLASDDERQDEAVESHTQEA